MSRRLLQATNALLGLTTVALAGTSLTLGAASPLYEGLPEIPALDSNLRFCGGLGIGLGLILLWIPPSFEVPLVPVPLVWQGRVAAGVG